MRSILLIVACVGVVSVSGRGGGGGRGRRGDWRPFLRNVTEEARQEYFRIERNGSLTKGQIKTQTEQWAVTNGVQAVFDEFNANRTAFRNEMIQNRTNTLEALPSKLDEFEEIINNDNNTRSQEGQQIREFFNAMSNDRMLQRAVGFFTRGPRFW